MGSEPKVLAAIAVNRVLDDGEREQIAVMMRTIADLTEQRDALVRALLAVEWGTKVAGSVAGALIASGYCAGCSGPSWEWKHAINCPVDAALTAAGLPDQGSRDEARGKL